jgi:hypothetical protein
MSNIGWLYRYNGCAIPDTDKDGVNDGWINVNYPGIAGIMDVKTFSPYFHYCSGIKI